MNAFITRFAPSPTGRLHLGHAFSALQVWRAAEEVGGQVLLRIEDIDTTRCKPILTEAIFEDLRWLGLSWPEPVRVQSEHFSQYASVVEGLAERGLAYRCFRTRAEVAATIEANKSTAFQGEPLDKVTEAEHLAKGDAFAWRLSLARVKDLMGSSFSALTYRVRIGGDVQEKPANPDLHGDIVIARKDSPSAYHVAATHDDHVQGITEVIRGEDLIDAPHTQTLLQVLMGWDHVIYRHHSLLLDADGTKLSKRHGSISLADLRADGMTAEQIRKQLGFR